MLNDFVQIAVDGHGGASEFNADLVSGIMRPPVRFFGRRANSKGEGGRSRHQEFARSHVFATGLRSSLALRSIWYPVISHSNSL